MNMNTHKIYNEFLIYLNENFHHFNPTVLLPYLVARGVITPNERAICEIANYSEDKNMTLFLEILPTKATECHQKVIDILRICGYTAFAEFLQERFDLLLERNRSDQPQKDETGPSDHSALSPERMRVRPDRKVPDPKWEERFDRTFYRERSTERKERQEEKRLDQPQTESYSPGKELIKPPQLSPAESWTEIAHTKVITETIKPYFPASTSPKDLPQETIKPNFEVSTQPKGLALLINNYDFGNPKLNRIGSEDDFVAMTSLLKQLGYAIKPYWDLTSEKIITTVKEFVSLLENENYQACVVVLMTHGHPGYFCGTDNKEIAEQDFVRPFREWDKPKIFIIQNCQLSMAESPKESTSEIHSICTDLPSETFMFYSTMPDSLFIQSLCATIGKNAHESWATTEKLAELVSDEINKHPPHAGLNQVPFQFYFKATKKFYFFQLEDVQKEDKPPNEILERQCAISTKEKFNFDNDLVKENETSWAKRYQLELDTLGLKPEAIGYFEPADLQSGGVPLSKVDAFYHNCSKPKGFALLISNGRFSGKYPDRTGSMIDLQNMTYLLQALGYNNFSYSDLKANEIPACVDNFANRLDSETARFDSCIVYFSTYAKDGKFIGIDGKETEMSSCFKPEHKKLSGKPKIFIVQACREPATLGPGDQIISQDQIKECEWRSQEEFLKNIPDAEDTCILHSTTPGYYNWRQSAEGGTWFVQTICEIFAQYAHEPWADLETLTTIVNKQLHQKFENKRYLLLMNTTMLDMEKYFHFCPKWNCDMCKEERRKKLFLSRQQCRLSLT